MAHFNTKHGGYERRGKPRPWYASWNAARGRCMNPNNPSYAHYGGRGITMCDRWLNDPGAFYEDMGDPPPGCTLDRIDNDGNYEPGNCQWSPKETQAANRSTTVYLTHEGETLSVIEWSERTGIPHRVLWQRVRRYGWTPARALTTPIRGGKRPGRRPRLYEARGRRRSLKEWAEIAGVSTMTMHRRLKKMSLEEALTVEKVRG